MNKNVEHLSHDELIEQNDSEQGNKHDDGCKDFFGVDLWIVGVLVFEFESVDKEVGFGEHNEVKNNSDYSEEKNGEKPSSEH